MEKYTIERTGNGWLLEYRKERGIVEIGDKLHFNTLERLFQVITQIHSGEFFEEKTEDKLGE